MVYKWTCAIFSRWEYAIAALVGTGPCEQDAKEISCWKLSREDYQDLQLMTAEMH